MASRAQRRKMQEDIEQLYRDTFVKGSDISLLDLTVSSIQYLARQEYWELVCTNLFGGKTEGYDDEEGYGRLLHSRFGQCVGSYYYWFKKVNRGEEPDHSIKLGDPILRIEHRGEFSDEEDHWEDCNERIFNRVKEIVSEDFLTMRGLITLCRFMFVIPDLDDIRSISVFDSYEPGDDSVLNEVVKQDPLPKKEDKNPRTRAECRKSGLFKAVEDGLSVIDESEIIAYSTLTGVFAAGDPAFLYIDESLKGRDLPDFISVSYGNAPTGGVGLGDGNTVYRCRLFDGLTSKCLKHIHYYDKLPEDMRHYLPHTSTPPMVGC